MCIIGLTYTKNAAHTTNPITVANSNQQIGFAGTTTLTEITFRREVGNVPAVSIYADLLTSGSISFVTKQILQCNCLSTYCKGTFKVSFDGVFGPIGDAINPKSDDGTLVVQALMQMESIINAGITVSCTDGLTSAICISGTITNHTFEFSGPLGNVPKIGLWSSIVGTQLSNPTTYSSDDSDTLYTSSILKILG